MLESVEILKIVDILTRIEAILSSLVIFVLLLEFSMGAIVLCWFVGSSNSILSR